MQDGPKQDSSVLNIAKFNVLVPSVVRDYSYSVTLRATVNAGDRVSLSVGAPNNSGRTRMMNLGQMIVTQVVTKIHVEHL